MVISGAAALQEGSQGVRVEILRTPIEVDEYPPIVYRESRLC